MNDAKGWSPATIITCAALAGVGLWALNHKNMIKQWVGGDAPAHPQAERVAAARLLGELEDATAHLRQTQEHLASYLRRFDERAVGIEGDAFFERQGRNFPTEARQWHELRVLPWQLVRESKALVEASAQARREITSNAAKAPEWECLVDQIETFCTQTEAPLRSKEEGLTRLLERFAVQSR
jgi:hypothetical protein